MEKVTKRYGKTLAADAVSAQLRDGALTALLGPSGCGKTTLLNVLAGIVPVTEGRVLFDEEDVTAWPPEKRNIGLVFQNYALYPHMTVLKNICFPLEIQRIPPQERLQRAQAIAALVHVQDLLNRKPDELSGGQQQRVAIARALVKEPRLLLLDEPLSNLDARLRLEMREEIRRIQRRTGVTTVFVTHDQEEAMSIADEIFLMRFGCLQQCAAPQTLYNEPSGLFVAEFLGNPPINRLAGFMQEGRFTLQDRSWSIPLGGVAVADGTPLVLAIRSESLLPDAGGFPFIAEDVYEIGKEEIVILRAGTASLRAFVTREDVPVKGSFMPMRFAKRGVFLFHAESGARVL